jgi:NADPH:quinone reductase-like Zn-dependent oxidoreductase
MQRILIDRPGGYERLRLEAAPDPEPGPGEVAVNVAAVGVNYADCVIRMGLYASARELVGYPITPGFEVAGTVAALGAGAEGPPPGTRVMGVTLFGGYATRICLPANQVFAIPDDLSFEAAAGFPTVFLTAWYALHELAHPHQGNRVLVHSAAGGVGGALLQLARRLGCRVFAVVGHPGKADTASGLGAGAVFARSATLWDELAAAAPGGFDVILDANGGPSLSHDYRHLAPGGKLVVYGFHTMLPKNRGRPSWLKLIYGYLRTPRFNPLTLTKDNRSVLAFNLSFMGEKAELLTRGLTDMLGWMAHGEIRPLSVTTFPFAEAAEAHRALESGDTTGKLVLVT